MADKAKKLYTPRAQLAFVALARPKLNQRGEPRYGAAFLFRPDEFTPEEKKLWDALLAEASSVAQGLGKVKGARSPFKSGKDQVRDDGTFWDGFDDGVVFFDGWTKFSPEDPDYPLTLVDLDQKTVHPGAFHSGCYARAKVHAYTYSEGGNKGVSFGLDGLQWLGAGERFGGGARDFGDAPPATGERPAHRPVSERAPAATGGSREEERPPERGFDPERNYDGEGSDQPF